MGTVVVVFFFAVYTFGTSRKFSDRSVVWTSPQSQHTQKRVTFTLHQKSSAVLLQESQRVAFHFYPINSLYVLSASYASLNVQNSSSSVAILQWLMQEGSTSKKTDTVSMATSNKTLCSFQKMLCKCEYIQGCTLVSLAHPCYCEGT